MSKFLQLITVGLSCLISFVLVTEVNAEAYLNKSIDPVFGISWDMDSAGGNAVSQADDRLGESLAAGDFNGDGYPDLAIGVPDRNIFVADAGAVVILYGSLGRLSNDNSTLLVSGLVDADEHFGKSLTSGDFNNDGFDDLVIGAPEKNFINPNSMMEFEDTGAIYVHYGSANGLLATGQFIDADENAELGSDRQEFAEFGSALTSGDFDGDGFDDLVVSAPRQNLPGADNAGMIFIYYGGQVISGNMGLYAEIRDTLNQSSPNVSGTSETNDFFGFSLAAGDFNNNGYDDLAIGVPFEAIGAVPVAGLVQVFYGNNLGLLNDDQIWQQADMVGAATEAGDLFGYSLAVGDINGDGNDDLIIGAPYEDIGAIADAGAAHYLPGSGIGLDDTVSITFTQNTAGVFGAAEDNDQFGFSVGATDLNVDGYSEVLIGVPFEENNGSESGFAHIIPGLATGLDFVESSFIAGQNANDNLGYSFSTSQNYLGPSLIVSSPGQESSDNDLDAGAILEFLFLNPDIIFKDGFDFAFEKR